MISASGRLAHYIGEVMRIAQRGYRQGHSSRRAYPSISGPILSAFAPISSALVLTTATEQPQYHAIASHINIRQPGARRPDEIAAMIN